MGKIEGFLLLLASLIIFFSATQLGLHFWPLSALVYGVRIDYLSPILYFLDLLIVLYLLFCGYFKNCLKFGAWNLVIALTPILLTNLLFSQNPLSTLSWSLHFLLYLVFLRTVLSPRSDLVGHPTRSDLTGILKIILPLTLFFQLALATAQVSLGHSVGGLMYYLGERSVAVGSPAVALGVSLDSVVRLRAYGTLSHPNVLAGWAVVSLLILIRLSKKIPWGALLLTTLLLILTESRAAALSLFGLIIPFYLIKNFKLRLLYYSITLLLYYSVFPPLLSPPRSDLSLTQRLNLQGVSLKVISHHPLFGTGAQSSISAYPTLPLAKPSGGVGRLLQPDHNSFTLFLSWFGLFGVSVLIYYFRICLGFRISNFGFILPLLPLLLLDHYLLTSPQGLFILILYFSIALNYTHVKNHR